MAIQIAYNDHCRGNLPWVATLPVHGPKALLLVAVQVISVRIPCLLPCLGVMWGLQGYPAVLGLACLKLDNIIKSALQLSSKSLKTAKVNYDYLDKGMVQLVIQVMSSDTYRPLSSFIVILTKAVPRRLPVWDIMVYHLNDTQLEWHKDISLVRS